VTDYLDLALAAPATGAEARALHSGVQLTRSKLTQALELVDVRAIPTDGAFDPALHEAAESRVSPGHAPGTILATVRPGYTWQGRILRPASVVVAAAPPAPEPGEPRCPPTSTAAKPAGTSSRCSRASRPRPSASARAARSRA
jgi:molecular chaperone GrpE